MRLFLPPPTLNTNIASCTQALALVGFLFNLSSAKNIAQLVDYLPPTHESQGLISNTL